MTHWQHNPTSIHSSNYLRIPLHGASTTSRPTKSTASSSTCCAPLRTTRQPVAAHQNTLPSYHVTWHLKGMHNLRLHAATSALPKGKFTVIALQHPLLLLDTDAIVDPHRSHLHNRVDRRQNHARTQFVSTHPRASRPFRTWPRGHVPMDGTSPDGSTKSARPRTHSAIPSDLDPNIPIRRMDASYRACNIDDHHSISASRSPTNSITHLYCGTPTSHVVTAVIEPPSTVVLSHSVKRAL